MGTHTKLAIMFLFCTATVSHASNEEIVKPTTGQAKDLVEFTAHDEGKGLQYKQFAKLMITSISLDTAGLEKELKDLNVPKANSIAEVVEAAAKEMEKQLIAKSQDLVDGVYTRYEAQFKTLKPKVKFLGTYSYFPGCCSDTKWKGIGANPEDTKLGESGVLSIDLRPSIHFFGGIEVQIELKASAGVNYKVSKINPVTPTSVTGTEIEVKGNPYYEVDISGSASAETLISIAIGSSKGLSGTLDQVTGKLVSGCK